MKHTMYIFHNDGHWVIDGHGWKQNAKGLNIDGRFDQIEIDETDNWFKELFRWNRYYRMQNGRKAALVTKVWVFEGPMKPREANIKIWQAKLACFILNIIPENLRRKRKWWFGL